MTEEVINGFGGRLNRMEIGLSQMEVKMNRSEQDIQKIFDGLETMKKTVNGFLWKIFLMIAIPTILLAIQILKVGT